MVNEDEILKRYKINKLNELLVYCEDEVERQLRRIARKNQEDYLGFLLYSWGKSMASAKEVIILCRAGFPDGALSISRSIFEQWIIMSYLESKRSSPSFKNTLERYNKDYDVQRAKALRFDAEYVNENEKNQQKYERILNKIKDEYKRGIGDYWWTDESGMSFNKMCDYVADETSEKAYFIRLLQLMYKRACLSIHASKMGNRIRLGSNDQCIDIGPWENGQETPLFVVTASLLEIWRMVFSTLNIKNLEPLHEMNNMAVYYHNMIRNKCACESAD